MGRTITGCTALCLACSVAIQSAEARDPKAAAGQQREAVSAAPAAREMQSVAAPKDAFSGSMARSASSTSFSAGGGGSRRSGASEQFNGQEPPRRNPLQMKLGKFTLEPAIGGIKGAQLSVDF